MNIRKRNNSILITLAAQGIIVNVSVIIKLDFILRIQIFNN